MCFKNKYANIVLYGLVLWLVPLLVGFLFVDATGTFIIPQTFFKTIMIITGSLVSVVLAVKYFKTVKKNFVHEGIILGLAWLAINLALDLVMVYTGFFPITVAQYFTDIGLRYLAMPIYTIGIAYALKK